MSVTLVLARVREHVEQAQHFARVARVATARAHIALAMEFLRAASRALDELEAGVPA